MSLKWIIKNSKSQLPLLVVVTVINGLYALFSVAMALFSRGVIDSAVAHDKSALVYYGAGMAMIIMLSFVIRIGSNSLSERIHARLGIIFRTHLLGEVAAKEYESVSNYHSGEILNRMFEDVTVVCDGVTSIVPSFVLMVTKGVCAVSVLLVLCPEFTVVFLIGGFVMVAVTAVFRGKMKILHKKVQASLGKVKAFLQEMLESLLIIKVFATEDKMMSRSEELQENYYRIRMKRRRISILAGAGVGLAFEIAYLVAMIVGAGGLMAGTMTYGTLTAILQLVSQVQQPFANLSGLIPRYYSMVASAERLMEIEELPAEPQNEEIDVKETYRNMLSICFRNVTFSYGRYNILTDASFTINKGDFVSVTGLSGGGKSTTFLLLLGAYRPSNGDIFINTLDGRVVLGRQTRPLFAYVPQRNHLFSGTIRDNITFLCEEVSDEQIEKALSLSCADMFVDTLPDGIDTVIGEQGHGLSEGQGQRIAIARALLSDAPILLLDEATSALDEETELKVLENISELRDRTCMIVTHRKAAIDFCNRHITISNGSLEEQLLQEL